MPSFLYSEWGDGDSLCHWLFSGGYGGFLGGVNVNAIGLNVRNLMRSPKVA